MSEKRKARKQTRVFWIAGVIVTLAVHAIGLLLFQLGDEEQPKPLVTDSFVSLPSVAEGQGDLLRERAYLFDSAPLFLPTRWNASSSPVVRTLEERPADVFDFFPPRLSFGEADFGLGSITSAKPGSALESLRAFGDRSYVSFGQSEMEQPKLSSRFALFEFVDPALGRTVFEVAVPLEGAPAQGRQLWAPAEFLVQFGATGLIGLPVLLRGSGVDGVDEHLRASLLRLTREQMFEVGYYRVLAGP